MSHPFRVFRTGTELRFWHLAPLMLPNLAPDHAYFAFEAYSCKWLCFNVLERV